MEPVRTSSSISRTKRLARTTVSLIGALALAASVSACQATGGRDTGAAVAPPAQAVPASEQDANAQLQPTTTPPATRDVLGGYHRSDTPVTVYLVGSTEQAEFLQWAMAEADAIRAQVGEPPLGWVVLLITSPAEEDWLLAALRDTDAARHQAGVPGLIIIDLRA